NHPVLERATGRVLVTSQNHGFAVAPSEAREATHVSLYDGTVEGLAFPSERAHSVQFHPEAGPGPPDAWPLLERWVEGVAHAEAGVLGQLGVELIGAPLEVIARAEDRELFREAVQSVGLRVPQSRIVTSLEDLGGVALPAVVRPAFTLGGHGGGFVETTAQLRRQVELGLAESPIGQVLVEESVRGWDEFELEVVRDRNDNVVIVCSIENIDPMGVHTGDSVTVAPQMTLSDYAHQELRDAAAAVIRPVGVERA